MWKYSAHAQYRGVAALNHVSHTGTCVPSKDAFAVMVEMVEMVEME
jgi:hypothetical protein